MYRRYINISSIFSSILLTSVVFYQGQLHAAPKQVQPVLISAQISAQISADEAQKFCLETWFPLLRIGHSPTPEELSIFVSKLLELYTDDIEMVDPNNKDLFGTDVLRGKGQVRRYYEAVLRNYPMWLFSILGIYPTESGFILRYEGRNAPPVDRFEGVDIIELRRVDGTLKISKLFGYYDRKPFLTGN